MSNLEYQYKCTRRHGKLQEAIRPTRSAACISHACLCPPSSNIHKFIQSVRLSADTALTTSLLGPFLSSTCLLGNHFTFILFYFILLFYSVHFCSLPVYLQTSLCVFYFILFYYLYYPTRLAFILLFVLCSVIE